jgi:prepilin-type N-terminal cleavage/methylation domain-containing protein
MGRVDVVSDARGFTLVEVLVSMVILTVGVMSLLGVMTVGLHTVGASSNLLIAREKAREAVESVHSARDTGELAWGRVRNVSEGGVFLGGMRDMRHPGVDGLINTADDGDYEVVQTPGNDGVIDTADDAFTPLLPNAFQREVLITTVNRDGTNTVNPNLRQLVVRVRYRVMNAWRTYELTTFVSAYS